MDDLHVRNSSASGLSFECGSVRIFASGQVIADHFGIGHLNGNEHYELAVENALLLEAIIAEKIKRREFTSYFGSRPHMTLQPRDIAGLRLPIRFGPHSLWPSGITRSGAG